MNNSVKERFQFLYGTYKKKKNKIEEIKQNNLKEVKFISNIAHINEKSREIVDDIHTKVFIHLFEREMIEMKEIPEKIQNFLLPLLDELREENETLDLDEFIMAMKHLHKNLPLEYKQFLMEWYMSFGKNKKNMSILECVQFPFKVFFLINNSLNYVKNLWI